MVSPVPAGHIVSVGGIVGKADVRSKHPETRAPPMPTIIDYPLVLDRMQGLGFVCNYHNGGSFAFPKGAPTHVVAHVGPPDLTIRPAALPFAIPIDPPHERNLARLASRLW